MSTPDPIGPIHFSEPRAVQVREPENLSAIHSAIHGDMNIYVDNKKEADAILSAWEEIMQQAADYAQAILDDIRNPDEDDDEIVPGDEYTGPHFPEYDE